MRYLVTCCHVNRDLFQIDRSIDKSVLTTAKTIYDVICSYAVFNVRAKADEQRSNRICGHLFRSSCTIQTSPTDCSDASYKRTHFPEAWTRHCDFWCGALEKHVLTYLLNINTNIASTPHGRNVGLRRKSAFGHALWPWPLTSDLENLSDTSRSVAIKLWVGIRWNSSLCKFVGCESRWPQHLHVVHVWMFIARFWKVLNCVIACWQTSCQRSKLLSVVLCSRSLLSPFRNLYITWECSVLTVLTKDIEEHGIDHTATLTIHRYVYTVR